MKITKLGGWTLSATALLLSSHGAFALDGQDFAKKLAAMVNYSNAMPLEFEDVITSGDTVTLKGVSIVFLNSAAKEPLKVPGDVVFSGVAETGDGGYTAKEGRITDIENKVENTDFSIKDLLVTEISVPATPSPRAMVELYRGFSVGPVSVKYEGTEVFALSDANASSVPGADGTYTGQYSVNGIHADLSAIDDAEVSGTLAMFGLTEINGQATGKMDWNLETGDMQINESRLSLTDIADLNVTMDIGGYDLEVLEAALIAQQDLSKAGNASAEELTAMNEKLSKLMMEKLILRSASIRFDDHSITGKVLDFVAAQQGAPREVMAAGLAAAVPAMTAGSGLSEEMQTMLATAVSEFLSDPKSLEIRLAPATPVRFADIEAAGEDPGAIAELFNLSVTANQ